MALIAFRQWRTAHDKLIVDLFDRRFKVYSLLEEAAALFEIGRGRDENAKIKARDGFLQAKFLFDEEAFQQVHLFYKAVMDFKPANDPSRYHDIAEQEQINNDALRVVRTFRREMPNTFEKYLRLDHKLLK